MSNSSYKRYFISHPLMPLILRVAGDTRRQMYDLFMREMRPEPSSRILDVGVTPHQAEPDYNFFEEYYPFKSQLTATSIEDASYLERKHPGLTFVQTSGTSLPFPDGHFDAVFSNAVIEHVGDRDRQRAFVAELLRVGRRVFLTTPNKGFPMEVHTVLPFLHWLPQRYHQSALRALGLNFWAQTENLNLLWSGELKALFPAGAHVQIRRQRLLGLTSHLIAISR